MQDRNLRVLELPKILARLSELTVSEPGRARAALLTPASDMETVQAMQDMTEEANTVFAYQGGSPMAYFTDVSPYLTVARAGGTLSLKALLDVAETLRASRVVRAALVTERDSTPHITEAASHLATARQTEEEIFNAILSETEIADRASSELYDIRRHIRQANDRMRDRLNQMIKSPAMQKYLQDTIITTRNGRYVVPVRAECRANVPGLIHDQSASGQTLYVEPMAVVEAGNDLKQWTAKEQKEIERILASLSGLIAPDADLIKNNISVLAELDLVFAKALLGREMNAVQPKLNSEGRINLISARHPLIDPEKVVPINLWMGGEFTELIITGPNTGGKTVTLKTVGLITLMAQSGLQIPAAPGSQIAVFDEVWADIGDEQSIEQSLSTFSSHMVNIVEILKNVGPGSMALFDELGAGTDPTEGAALAMSILEELNGRRATVLATTHYAELKAYALSTIGVENASVEFDLETLRPTYRLSIGVPGKSNAFEISRKLGLPEKIIAGAAERLSKNQIRFEDVIANAEYHRQIAEKERRLAEEAHVETQRLRTEAEKTRRELEGQKDEMLKKAREEAKRVVQKAQRESEGIISELKRKSASGLREHELQNMRRQLQEAADRNTDTIFDETRGKEGTLRAADVKVGDTVELTHLNTKGTILTPPDAKGEMTVQAGIMKIKANISQMRPAKPEKSARPRSGGRASLSAAPVKMECDVRGMTLEEALMSVDLFLDGVMLQGLKIVSIIHGKGTGVLRAGVQDHLKHHPGVKEYRLGHYGEGEDGVTVVTMK